MEIVKKIGQTKNRCILYYLYIFSISFLFLYSFYFIATFFNIISLVLAPDYFSPRFEWLLVLYVSTSK